MNDFERWNAITVDITKDTLDEVAKIPSRVLPTPTQVLECMLDDCFKQIREERDEKSKK